MRSDSGCPIAWAETTQITVSASGGMRGSDSFGALIQRLRAPSALTRVTSNPARACASETREAGSPAKRPCLSEGRAKNQLVVPAGRLEQRGEQRALFGDDGVSPDRLRKEGDVHGGGDPHPPGVLGRKAVEGRLLPARADEAHKAPPGLQRVQQLAHATLRRTMRRRSRARACRRCGSRAGFASIG